MAACWWCYWGWPKPIADIFDDCVEPLGGDEGPLLYGAAHVVWGDENWGAAESCLRDFNAFRGDYTPSQLSIVRESLERLVPAPGAGPHRDRKLSGFPGPCSVVLPVDVTSPASQVPFRAGGGGDRRRFASSTWVRRSM